MYRIIIFIIVVGYMNRISSESISSQIWSGIIEDLSLKIHNDKNIESHPLNEGFIILSNDNTKPSPIRTKLKPAQISHDKKIFKSNNISSTTCRTVIIMAITKQPSPPIADHSIGHLGRRLLNEPSYDNDLDTPLKQMPIDIDSDDDKDMETFMKIDNEELSKQLFNMEITIYGSGDTTDETTEQTSQSTATSLESTTQTTTEQTSQSTGTSLEIKTQTTPATTEQTSQSTATSLETTTSTTAAIIEQPILSNKTTFILTINCPNANDTFHVILTQLTNNFGPYDLINNTDLECPDDSKEINVTLEIATDNSPGVLNDLFGNISAIATSEGAKTYSVNKCGNNGIELIPTNFTSCYIIDLCHLCGINPRRGVCLPENKESKCECFPNKNDLSRPYVGDLCFPDDSKPTKSPSIPSRWTPVIVGILAGLTGVFAAVAGALWAISAWGRQIPLPKPAFGLNRLWHLPRAQVPTSGTSGNVPDDLNDTLPSSTSNQPDSDYSPSNTSDSTFFKELDKKMGENLRATITRPNTNALLSSLPSDTIPSSSIYDPINELDAIIDHEDLNTTFHDPLDELFEDNEMLEVVNPNLKLS